VIPNIFVSSTVHDLRYLRDGLRDTIESLGYNPVQNEYGGIGYLNPMNAAEASIQSVAQCQMMVLIIGKRYGSLGANDLSITHNEMLTARESRIPFVTFVDQEVLAYKKIYDANRQIPLKDFPDMDQPGMTFRLIEEVMQAPSYNGLIPFGTVSEAKSWLKKQIAHFVGDRLAEAVSPIRREILDIRSDVKAILNQLGKTENPESAKFIKAMRFLLDDANETYRKVVEKVFGNIDVAVKNVISALTFEDVVKRSGYSLEIADQIQIRSLMNRPSTGGNAAESQLVSAHNSWNGSYAIFSDRRIVLDEQAKQEFDSRQAQLQIQLS
jgi:hypothetical protein